MGNCVQAGSEAIIHALRDTFESIDRTTDMYFFHPQIISTFSICVIEILKMIAMATKRDKRLY